MAGPPYALTPKSKGQRSNPNPAWVCIRDGHESIYVDPTQLNPTANGPNPTQPTFRNTVLRKDTVNSLGYNLQYEPRCPKCLTAEQHGVSEIVYQSMTHAHLSKIMCHLQYMYVIAFVWNYCKEVRNK